MIEYDYYRRARAKGKLNRVIGAIFKRCNQLAALVELKNGHVFAAQQHNGVEQIHLSCIVGSVNRARDFDRDFNPLNNSSYARWESVNRAFLNGVALPPVELQKVVDDYYVVDGHHRISVAKFHRVEYIDARVIDSICPVEAAALSFV